MSFVNSMVFVLPADSGERVGYAITCLLSLSVYMTYASDNLPRSSRTLPIITVVLISYIIISAFISVGTVIGLREKEGDLTQSCDKTPYTNRKFENQRTTHERHQKL